VRWLLAVVLLTLAPVLASVPPAGAVPQPLVVTQGCTSVSDVHNETVSIANNLTCPSGSAFIIRDSSSINFNCNGHALASSVYALEIISSINVAVSGCNVSQNYDGILVNNTSHASIFGSSFFNNTVRGVWLSNSNYSELANDNFTFGIVGIDVSLSSYGLTEDVSISRTIQNGIAIFGGNGDTVESSALTHNYGTSILLRNGPTFWTRTLVSYENVVTNNTIEASLGPAIELAGADDNNISKNVIVGSGTGIDVASGNPPVLDESNTLTDNTILSCGPQAESSAGNTFTRNRIADLQIGSTQKEVALPQGVPVRVAPWTKTVNLTTISETPLNASIKVTNLTSTLDVGSSESLGGLNLRLVESHVGGFDALNGTFVVLSANGDGSGTSTSNTSSIPTSSVSSQSGSSQEGTNATPYVVAIVVVLVIAGSVLLQWRRRLPK
jgi:hypothetical protein